VHRIRTELRADALWLRGNKRFAACGQATTGNEDANSHSHPARAFPWAEYAAEPARTGLRAWHQAALLRGQRELTPDPKVRHQAMSVAPNRDPRDSRDVTGASQHHGYERIRYRANPSAATWVSVGGLG
jgi:hypothetical protein